MDLVYTCLWNASVLEVQQKIGYTAILLWFSWARWDNIQCKLLDRYLQAGSEDGCVVLFDTDYNSLQYYKSFDKQEGMDI